MTLSSLISITAGGSVLGLYLATILTAVVR